MFSRTRTKTPVWANLYFLQSKTRIARARVWMRCTYTFLTFFKNLSPVFRLPAYWVSPSRCKGKPGRPVLSGRADARKAGRSDVSLGTWRRDLAPRGVRVTRVCRKGGDAHEPGHAVEKLAPYPTVPFQSAGCGRKVRLTALPGNAGRAVRSETCRRPSVCGAPLRPPLV